MSRSAEAEAYDRVRIRYEVATLAYRDNQRRVQVLSDRLDYERETNPHDRNSIRRRTETLERAQLRIDRLRDSRDRKRRRLEQARQTLRNRLSDEYTLMRQRGYARELADQIARENNTPLDDDYYEQSARQMLDNDI